MNDAYRRGYDQIEWKSLPPVERKPIAESKRADFPIPMMVRDFDDPVQSMADASTAGAVADNLHWRAGASDALAQAMVAAVVTAASGWVAA